MSPKVRFREPASSSSSSKPPLIPRPFSAVPESLSLFTSDLDRSRIYITHIDNHPIHIKRTYFLVPFFLNLSIFLLLAWRAYIVLPWYLIDLPNLLIQNAGSGNMSSWTSNMSWSSVIKTEVRYFATFLMDYYLAVVVARWPWSFFAEGFDNWANPMGYRWKLGFRDRELIVRASRGTSWSGRKDLFESDDKNKRGEASPFWMTKVMPAIQPERLAEKSGYVLMDADWDLEFGDMVLGEDILADKELEEKDLNGWVWGFVEGEGWVRWSFMENLFGAASISTATAADGTVEEVGDVDEGKKMVLKFREELIKMGKEDLFFKWVELIQYESSRPGGFTKERQVEAGFKVKELFDRFGVDFDEFQKAVGIVDGKFKD